MRRQRRAVRRRIALAAPGGDARPGSALVGARHRLSALTVVENNGARFLVYGTATVAALREDPDGWRLYERPWPRFTDYAPTHLLDAEDVLIEALERTARRIAEVEWLEDLRAWSGRATDSPETARPGATPNRPPR